MLAYIFWHRGNPRIERQAYEKATIRFQRDLLQRPSPGLIGAASFRIEAVPWLGDQPGYEDWYYLAGSWAMDPLNAYAVADETLKTHDVLAAQMAVGYGGLYAHAWGEERSASQSTMIWLTRPRGIQWKPVLETVRTAAPSARCWRRQMVLGPAREFVIEIDGESDVTIPAGWGALRIARERLAQ
jgi:hypothetical protein